MPSKSPTARTAPPAFNVQRFLKAAGATARTVRFATGAAVFAQGAPANSVFYLQDGGVKLSVLSTADKEAVVAMLGPGDFSAKAVWPASRSGWAGRRRSCVRPCCESRNAR